MAAPGYGGTEDQFMFHVPQQSRREKLRYAQEIDHHHHHHHHHHLQHHHHTPSFPTPQFHHTGVIQPPPSSSSHHHHHHHDNQNPTYHDNSYSTFCTQQPPPPPLMSLFSNQISTTNHHQQPPFSLSLSSSSSLQALPPRQQLGDGPSTNLGPTPLGPFTGYSEILSRSRFLEPARHLLEEVCSVGGVVRWSEEGEGEAAAAAVGEGRVVAAAAVMVVEDERQQQQWKKTKLLSMLDEVYSRYKLYYQQIQAIVTSFESVPGLSSAAPYASLALKVMSKHFRCLKNAISDQLQHMNKATGIELFGEEENNSTTGFGILTSSVSPHRQANNYGTIRQPHVWRPQRGLPERAVAVLRAWLFEHFLHPYPTDTDKQMLAKQTGLTRNQGTDMIISFQISKFILRILVSNWFINARVRLWKPMVEEIHSLEQRQQNKSGDMNLSITSKQPQLPSSSTPSSSNDPPFENHNQTNPNQSSKQPQTALTQIPSHIQDPNFNLVYDAFHGHHNVGLLGGSGGGVDVKGNGGGVSLTLGLHQNNGICLTEPISIAHRFGLGLDEGNDAYVIGSYEGQERHFEKDIGGHFLRDFVG